MCKLWDRRSVICFLIFLLSDAAVGQQHPKYNAPAPPFALELVQSASGATATLESLKGQAVILEFWATWCAGCVAQIPHLNSIADSFRDKPVRFISVTDEDRDIVDWFLSKRPISGWVAIDKNGDTFRNYGVIGRPQTVLIDATGTYRGEIPGGELSQEKVKLLLAGTLRLDEPADNPSPRIGTEPNGPSPLVQVVIRTAMDVEQTGMSPGARRQTQDTWETWGLTLKGLFSYCSGFSEARIIVPQQYEKPRYDLLVTVPNATDENRKKIVWDALETTFQSNARREVREMNVYVLRKRKGVVPALVTSEQGKSVASLVPFMEGALRRPVVDESGLEGRYKFVWAYTTGLTAINAQLQGVLGLELVAERRPVEVLVFEPQSAVP